MAIKQRTLKNLQPTLYSHFAEVLAKPLTQSNCHKGKRAYVQLLYMYM